MTPRGPAGHFSDGPPPGETPPPGEKSTGFPIPTFREYRFEGTGRRRAMVRLADRSLHLWCDSAAQFAPLRRTARVHTDLLQPSPPNHRALVFQRGRLPTGNFGLLLGRDLVGTNLPTPDRRMRTVPAPRRSLSQNHKGHLNPNRRGRMPGPSSSRDWFKLSSSGPVVSQTRHMAPTDLYEILIRDGIG